MRWMWIDRVIELVPGERMVAIKNISLSEEHLHDHFPATATRLACPVMPASLIVEGMAQTAGILVGHAEAFREKVILAKVSNATLDEDAGPGDQLRYTATVNQKLAQGAATSGLVEIARAGSRSFEEIGRIDLMFSYLDQNMSGMEFPEHNFVFGAGFRTLLESSGVEIPV